MSKQKSSTNGYKFTRSTLLDNSLFPLEWNVESLGEIGEISVGYPFPSENFLDHPAEGAFPLVRIRDLPNKKTDTYVKGPFDEGVVERYTIEKGDILIGMDGYFHIATWHTTGCLLNQRATRIRHFRKDADQNFIKYAVVAPIKKIEHDKHFTTVKHLSMGDLYHLPIPFPPLPEQKAIAHVLQTVQEAKEKTEEVVRATKELKKSMMKHLFTYGPVPPEKAENVKLKETEIGMIPDGWDIVQLDDICEKIIDGNYGGKYPKTHEFIQNGIPFLTSTVIDLNGYLKKEAIKYISEEIHFNLKKAHTFVDDVILTNRGANVGSVSIIPDWVGNCNIGPQLTKFTAKKDRLLPLFLKYVLSHDIFQRILKSSNTGTAMNFISLTNTKKLLIPFAPYPIQEQIASILFVIDRKIEAEENKKKTLEELSRTLLHDLMTAKIRVRTLEA